MQRDLCSFALALYAQEGVEAACLNAQEAGQCVCFLLCAAWLDSRQIHWTPAREQQLRKVCSTLEDAIIEPLRALRRAWKKHAHDTALEALRQRLKTLELDSEMLLLERLQLCAQSWPAQPQEQARWLAALALKEPLRRTLSQPVD